MKIYISNYRNHWYSPYKICEKICFWREIGYDEPWVVRVNKVLEPIMTLRMKFLELVFPRIEYVKIDRWDTWSMDHTLAYIILPMLKQLKATTHGAPNVDDDDVPEELKSTTAPPKENEYDTDGNHFKRWDWVLDEMIFAFEHKVDDSWEEEFRSGKHDIKHEPCAWDENGKPTMYQMVRGPNDTYKCDYDGIAKVHDRMKNGFRLFGKYYEGLWD